MTSKDEVDALFRTAKDTYGSVDIAFNNAGISPPEDDSILDTDLDAWRQVQEVNLTTVYLCCKAALPYMLEQERGSIINTASFVAVMGAATSQISYSASKGGVLSMSRELGVQFAREGVRVNALCPGPVNTPLLQELFAKDEERAARRLVHVPMGRFGEPEEMASAVLFLASDDSSFMTASTFLVDGGISGAYVTPLTRTVMRSGHRADHLPRAGGVGRLGPARRPAADASTPMRSTATGGVPVLLPPIDEPGAADVVVARLDGLVISGGADVDPSRYGAEPHERTAAWRPDRDAWEPALLDAADAPRPAGARRLPRHAGDGGPRRRHARPAHPGPGRPRASTAPAATSSATVGVRHRAGLAGRGLVGDTLAVSCHHHQSVRTHPGFVPSARADDGTLEAMEAPGDRFCVAVQWHPETAADVGLLAGTGARRRRRAADRLGA